MSDCMNVCISCWCMRYENNGGEEWFFVMVIFRFSGDYRFIVLKLLSLTK